MIFNLSTLFLLVLSCAVPVCFNFTYSAARVQRGSDTEPSIMEFLCLNRTQASRFVSSVLLLCNRAQESSSGGGWFECFSFSFSQIISIDFTNPDSSQKRNHDCNFFQAIRPGYRPPGEDGGKQPPATPAPAAQIHVKAKFNFVGNVRLCCLFLPSSCRLAWEYDVFQG